MKKVFLKSFPFLSCATLYRRMFQTSESIYEGPKYKQAMRIGPTFILMGIFSNLKY